MKMTSRNASFRRRGKGLTFSFPCLADQLTEEKEVLHIVLEVGMALQIARFMERESRQDWRVREFDLSVSSAEK